MKLTRVVLAAFLLGGMLLPSLMVTSSSALAQATCRSKCNGDEQACLKRTSNKGQCGSKAKACLAKCK